VATAIRTKVQAELVAMRLRSVVFLA